MKLELAFRVYMKDDDLSEPYELEIDEVKFEDGELVITVLSEDETYE